MKQTWIQGEYNMDHDIVVEIRPAEGGDDSKLFAADLAAAYVKMLAKFG